MDKEDFIKFAQAEIKAQYGYIFHEGTAEILDPEHYTWIAQVTITHNAQEGSPECTLFLLAVWADFVLFEKTAIPALTDWCLKMPDERYAQHAHDLIERNQQLEQLVREYHTLVEQGFKLAFPEDEQEWRRKLDDVQQQAGKYLAK